MTLPATESKALADHQLHQIAERIRTRIRRTVTDIIDTGQDLAQVKASHDHGQFSEWIEREFSMSMRTAQRYMQAAEWAEGKNDIVAHLPPTTLYLLADKSTPKEIQAKVVSDLEAGKEIDPRQIKDRVAEAREEQRAAVRDEERRAARSPEERKRRAAARRRREREEEKRKAEREAREQRTKAATEAAVKILLKLDRENLDRLVEALRDGNVWHIREILIGPRAGSVKDGAS